MKPAVMTTGPGVISPMATASRNCPWVSQVVLGDDAVAQQRHDGQAGAEDQGAGLQEEKTQGQQGSARHGRPEESGRRRAGDQDCSLMPLPFFGGRLGLCRQGRCREGRASSRSIMIPSARIMGTGSEPVSAVTPKTVALIAQSRQSRRSVILRSL